eukprot:TRINITY_DN41112_c0_g1_i1.p1 TRINITY_DN41112_c0_g1~~TRINITY_DN41112_c0_g1_i1.p1  ORF type:complete len:445 (-),score=92.06 TRINITY_DN41112_c0_g1_i1:157-1443(-)
MVKPILMPPPGQTLPADAAHVIEQLERHCLAPDGSLVSKSAYYDLQMAREEMAKERVRYLEAMALYCEAVTLVEEHQQAVSVASLGGIRDLQPLFIQLGLRSSPQVYEALEKRLVIAEASQRLRLPLLSKDGDIPEEEIEKWSIISRSSTESTNTSFTLTSSTNTTSSTSLSSNSNNVLTILNPENTEVGIGGIANRFLGVTPRHLQQTHLQRTHFMEDNSAYQMSLALEVEARLKSKCDKLSNAFQMDEIDAIGPNSQNMRLSERVKSGVEEIEREEAALLEDLYSSDRKFAEYYNVLEQILGVLLKLVKDFKLQHQHQYDGLRKDWLCKRCETMNAKLRVLEHLLLRDTYTQESIPALHKIRQYLLEATEEASSAYSKAVTRLREYQGVDPHFDSIARRYHELVKKLEGIQWTIRQVEMDLNNSGD